MIYGAIDSSHGPFVFCVQSWKYGEDQSSCPHTHCITIQNRMFDWFLISFSRSQPIRNEDFRAPFLLVILVILKIRNWNIWLLKHLGHQFGFFNLTFLNLLNLSLIFLLPKTFVPIETNSWLSLWISFHLRLHNGLKLFLEELSCFYDNSQIWPALV